MSLALEIINGAVYVSGNTFDVKNILKRNGARWDSFRQAWKFTDEATAQVAFEEAEQQLAVNEELAALDAA